LRGAGIVKGENQNCSAYGIAMAVYAAADLNDAGNGRKLAERRLEVEIETGFDAACRD